MRKTLALALALTVAMLCACRPPAADDSSVSSASVSSQSGSNTGGQPVRPVADSGQYYTLRYYDHSEAPTLYFMNAAGDTRIEHNASHGTIYDPDSRLPLYQIVWQYEDTGERDEWTLPIADATCFVRDMQGNALLEETEGYLSSVAGDWLLHHPLDRPAYLYNVKTGESRFEDIGGILPLGNNFLILDRLTNAPLAIVDRDMNTVHDVSSSPVWNMQHLWRDYVLAYDEDFDWEAGDDMYLLSSSLEPLYSFNHISARDDIAGGDWLQYNDGDGYALIDAATGQCYSDPYSFIYGDSERLIRQYNNVSYLYDSAGHALTEPYDCLAPVGGDPRAPSERFCGARDGQLEIIDRDGAVLISRPWEEHVGYMGIWALNSNLICVGGSNVALLDTQLNVIIPPGAYLSLERPKLPGNNYFYYDEATTAKADFITAWKTVGNVDVQDLYDLNGNLIISNVRILGDFGPDAIMVLRGSTVGLIDYHGNWLNRASVYGNHTND